MSPNLIWLMSLLEEIWAYRETPGVHVHRGTTKEISLRRNQNCWHLGLKLPEVWDNKFLLLKPPSLWYFCFWLHTSQTNTVGIEEQNPLWNFCFYFIVVYKTLITYIIWISSSPGKWVLLLTPFYRWSNWGALSLYKHIGCKWGQVEFEARLFDLNLLFCSLYLSLLPWMWNMYLLLPSAVYALDLF